MDSSVGSGGPAAAIRGPWHMVFRGGPMRREQGAGRRNFKKPIASQVKNYINSFYVGNDAGEEE